MINDTVLKVDGFKYLAQKFGRVDAERFISLIIKEQFDYTEWRKGLFENMSVREISNAAKKYCDELSVG